MTKEIKFEVLKVQKFAENKIWFSGKAGNPDLDIFII